MKTTFARTALAASIALGLAPALSVSAQADAAAVNDGVVTTPTDLAELLGPDGLEGAQAESYLHMQVTGQVNDSSVMHWALTVQDGRLISTMRTLQSADSSNVQRQVYTGDGAFVESSSDFQSPDYKSSTTMVREGETVRVTSSSSFDGQPGGPEDSQVEVVDYQPMADALPTAWLPIVLAYHIREGHEQFTTRMHDDPTGRSDFVQVFTAEDIGTERVEVGGEEVEAHVMMLTVSTEMGGEAFDGGVDDEQVMQLYVLADGTIIKMRMEMEGMTMAAERITAEEAEALMNTDDPAVPGGERGAGNDVEDAGDAIRDAAE